MIPKLSTIKNINFFLYLALTFILLAGLFFRIKGLGKWPLAVDEYYIVKSVQSILANGLPQFSAGGYYERGILYQYITSLFIFIGIKNEFAARIIPVITNFLTVIPIYGLAKRLSNKYLSVFIVFMFCFSVWEVEFARFARMYSPFQLIFMLYTYNLYKFFVERDPKTYKWLFLLSCISILIYEASIFLAIINFLPIFWDSEKRVFTLSKTSFGKRNLLYLILSVLILIMNYFFLNFNFRFLGQTNLYPMDYSIFEVQSSKFRIPSILIITTLQHPYWWIFSVLFSIAIFYFCLIILKHKEFHLRVKAFLIVVLLLSYINLYGLTFILIIVFMLLNWISFIELKKSLKFIIPIFLITAIYWSAYILFSDSFRAQTTNNNSINALKNFYKYALNYPYLYETFVLFRNTVPKLTYIILILLGTSLIITLKQSKTYFGYNFLFFVMLILILMINLLNLTYFDTRYFLFIYPLIILLSIVALNIILYNLFANKYYRIISFVLVCFLIFKFSEDFDLKHLYNIDSKEVTFRTGKSLPEKVHFYPRWDTRSPAEYINLNASANDIIISNEQVNELYLKRLDYIYRDFRGIEFLGESVEGGKKERWTNANLIYNECQLMDLINRDSLNKWVLINTLWGIRHLKANNFFNEYRKYSVYANFDSSAIVYKIPSDGY